MLIRDVREIEEVGEAARHGQRRFYRHRPQLLAKPLELVLGRAGTRSLRHRADPLDPFVVADAFVATQRFAEQLAEQPHVVAERFVRIRSHGPQ